MGKDSFIGFNPKARLSYKNGTLTVTGEGARVVKTAKPYDALRKYLADYKTPHFKDIPPFTGGLVGYFGYAMISVAEPVLKLKRGDTNDFDMMLFDKIIAYDHLKEKLIIIVNMKTNDTKAQYELAKKDIALHKFKSTSPVTLKLWKGFGRCDCRNYLCNILFGKFILRLGVVCFHINNDNEFFFKMIVGYNLVEKHHIKIVCISSFEL